MAILHEYHRPETLAEAVALLARTDRRLLPLAGGSKLVGELELRLHPDVDGVVDLRRLGLDEITVLGSRLVIGATVTLAALGEHLVTGMLAGGLLRRAAQGEGPINLRNTATVGGVVAAAEPDSELYAALLAFDATVTQVVGGQTVTTPLTDLGRIQGLITEVAISLPPANLHGGAARVARTPADRPIVAALAVVGPNGVRIGLCGAAPRPILAGMPLDPPDDFKGSAAYRRAMVEVVTARALAEARA